MEIQNKNIISYNFDAKSEFKLRFVWHYFSAWRFLLKLLISQKLMLIYYCGIAQSKLLIFFHFAKSSLYSSHAALRKQSRASEPIAAKSASYFKICCKITHLGKWEIRDRRTTKYVSRKVEIDCILSTQKVCRVRHMVGKLSS